MSDNVNMSADIFLPKFYVMHILSYITKTKLELLIIVYICSSYIIIEAIYFYNRKPLLYKLTVYKFKEYQFGSLLIHLKVHQTFIFS